MSEEVKTPEVRLDTDFEADERLFHYTSSEGLYGILDSNCLWATHFKFLNDSKEFYAARESLVAFAGNAIKTKLAALKVNQRFALKDGVTLSELSAKEAEVIVDAMYTVTLRSTSPFVFSSFACSPVIGGKKNESFRNGELLHWASYGRGGGYALEINPHKLMVLTELLMKRDGIATISQKAEYTASEVPEGLASDYATIGRVAQEMVELLMQDRLVDADIPALYLPFLKAASVIKDPYFKGEGEARLVAIRLNKALPDKLPVKIYARQNHGLTIPYIKLFEEMLFEHCPIEAIVVGPHRDKERRADALRTILAGRGLAEIEVVESDVPYLGG